MRFRQILEVYSIKLHNWKFPCFQRLCSIHIASHTRLENIRGFYWIQKLPKASKKQSRRRNEVSWRGLITAFVKRSSITSDTIWAEIKGIGRSWMVSPLRLLKQLEKAEDQERCLQIKDSKEAWDFDCRINYLDIDLVDKYAKAKEDICLQKYF